MKKSEMIEHLTRVLYSSTSMCKGALPIPDVSCQYLHEWKFVKGVGLLNSDSTVKCYHDEAAISDFLDSIKPGWYLRLPIKLLDGETRNVFYAIYRKNSCGSYTRVFEYSTGMEFRHILIGKTMENYEALI